MYHFNIFMCKNIKFNKNLPLDKGNCLICCNENVFVKKCIQDNCDYIMCYPCHKKYYNFNNKCPACRQEQFSKVNISQDSRYENFFVFFFCSCLEIFSLLFLLVSCFVIAALIGRLIFIIFIYTFSNETVDFSNYFGVNFVVFVFSAFFGLIIFIMILSLLLVCYNIILLFVKFIYNIFDL